MAKAHLPPDKKVIKINERHYQQPCCMCEEPASVWEIGDFKWGGADYANQNPLVYRGAGGRGMENPRHAAKIFAWLERNDVAQVRAYTREQRLVGFDNAYCPECDRSYCARHYVVVRKVDSDDYEQDFATCPLGHRRAIWQLHGSPPARSGP